MFTGNFHNLTELDLSSNHFHGPIPDSVQHLESFSYLRLTSNKLNDSILDSLGQLSHLLKLYLSNNQFIAVTSETLFSNLIRLKELCLDRNQIVVNLSSN